MDIDEENNILELSTTELEPNYDSDGTIFPNEEKKKKNKPLKKLKKIFS